MIRAKQRVAHTCDTRVRVNYPTADGAVTGDGEVLQLIDHAPCGASGFRQPVYLVRVDDPELAKLGKELKVIPHEYLTIKETAK